MQENKKSLLTKLADRIRLEKWLNDEETEPAVQGGLDCSGNQHNQHRLQQAETTLARAPENLQRTRGETKGFSVEHAFG